MTNYQRDGVAVLRGALNEDALTLLALAIDHAASHPSPFSRNLADNGSTFFNDFDTWRKNAFIKTLADSLAPICAEATGDTTLRLFHDHVIVKSGMAPKTPWHQDRPYYVVEGPNNFTIWCSPQSVPKEEGLQFIPGSHLNGCLYLPVEFTSGNPIPEDRKEAPKYFRGENDMTLLDDTELLKLINKHGVWGTDMEPGDALIFDNRIVHKARRTENPAQRSSLSIRYLGDRATMTKRCVNPTPPFDRMGLKFNEGDQPDSNWFPVVYP